MYVIDLHFCKKNTKVDEQKQNKNYENNLEGFSCV